MPRSLARTGASAVPLMLVALVVLLSTHSARSAQASDAPTAVQHLSEQHLCGVYRGTVQSATDPEHKSRVQVRVPQADVSGLWASPGSAAAPLPAVGAQVWVMFEAGSAAHPVWFGAAPPGG